MEEHTTMGGPESRSYDPDNELEQATGMDVDMSNAVEDATDTDVDVKTPE